MTAPLDPEQASAAWWDDEGRRIALELVGASVILVVGIDTGHAARVALGIARAESNRRHVALGDLTGDAAPLYAVAGGEDAFGLSDCLRQGLPLNDIARPAPDHETLFILPAGSPPVACEEILSHERWSRLVKGFTEVAALLVLVAPPDAPGLGSLAAVTGGVVLVDDATAVDGNLRVLARASAPAPAAVPASEGAAPRWGPARSRSRIAMTILVLGIGAAAWSQRGRIGLAYRRIVASRTTAPTAMSPAGPAAAPPARDTVQLADPVNPADTSGTAPFAVEVMAANTIAGANSFLSDNSTSTLLTGATLSPVAAGGSTDVWYKVVVGATHVRPGADSLLGALRREGVVSSEQGRVVQVPYALLLASGVERAQAVRLLDEWKRRGFNPYLLVQRDNSACVLVGAFETTAQAATLASALRAAGAAPVLVFRTGRTY